jgi:hypothetical protein
MLNKKNIVDTEQDLHKYYPELSNLLAAYFAVDADNDIFDVNHTINEFCSTNYLDSINKTISQISKILEINPFPYTTIETATNIWISDASDEVQKAEDVKKWLRNVLYLLDLRVSEKL